MMPAKAPTDIANSIGSTFLSEGVLPKGKNQKIETIIAPGRGFVNIILREFFFESFFCICASVLH